MKKTLVEFIKKRARATISAAKAVAVKWTWQEMTIDQMEQQLEAITGNDTVSPPVVGQEEVASQAQRALNNAEGAWKTQLSLLHQLTVQGLSMAKTKFRSDPANLAVVSDLHASGGKPERILAEALAWESAWGKTAPAWSPSQSNTFDAYKALRKQCVEDLQNAFTDAASASREAAGTLEQMARALEDTNVAWYADATRIFAAGTPEGDMIRSSVPTTYTPPADKPTPPPAPAAAKAQPHPAA